MLLWMAVVLGKILEGECAGVLLYTLLIRRRRRMLVLCTKPQALVLVLTRLYYQYNDGDPATWTLLLHTLPLGCP